MAAAAAIVLAAPAAAAAGQEDAMATKESLIGRWEREPGPPCAEAYPPAIELRGMDVYLAPEGPMLGSIWHGGGWRVEAGDTLVVEAANDANLRYSIVAVDAGALELEDASGCRIRYRRA